MTTDSAIQQDVQNDTAQATGTDTSSNLTPEPTARELAMDALAANRRQAFEEETGISLDDPDADAGEAEAAAARAKLSTTGQLEADPDAQLAAQLQGALPTDPAVLASKVRVKIDGLEQEVTLDEMRREYQKGKTADKRLEEATRAREEANRILAAAQQQPQPTQTPDPVALAPEVTKKFTSALFEGDEEAAGLAFAEAVDQAVQSKLGSTGRGNATQVDADTIANQVIQQMQFNSALERNRQDYPGIYADPDVEALAAAKIQRTMSEGKPFLEALETVTSSLSKQFGFQTPGRSDPVARSTATRDAKLERKARLTDQVTGLGIKSSTTETPPATHSQIIAEIARSRGQTV